jgi:hypothetical protein
VVKRKSNERICQEASWLFSERHDESIYFDSDEEMEGWLESFRQEFGKPFMYIE